MNLDKGISTPIALLLIIVCSVVVGVLVWHFKSVKSPKSEPIEPDAATSEDSEQDTLACGDDVTFTYQGEEVTYGTVSYNGECWMDRNLGANFAANDPFGGCGDLFQWGRLADGHQLIERGAYDSEPVYGTTSECSSDNTPGHNKFVIADSSTNYDWRCDDNRAGRWCVSASSITNNPCPDGWRIPTESEWLPLADKWIGCAQPGKSVLKLPLAGYRSYSDGSFTNLNTHAIYWSSTLDGSDVKSLYLYADPIGDGVVIESFHQTYGGSVRCIKN